MKNRHETIKNDKKNTEKYTKSTIWDIFLSLWGAKKVNKSYIV